MATLVRAPEQLENEVRISAKRQGQPINSWWVAAAEDKLRQEKIDLKTIAHRINADPVMREVLDRLGQ